MTELANAAYSLQEAAKLLHQSTVYLLKKCIEEKIPLYTPLPEQSALFSVDYLDRFPPSNKSRSIQCTLHPPSLPFRVSRPQFLELHPDTCNGLLNNGASCQSEFERAIVIHNDGKVEVISAHPPKTPDIDYLLDGPRNSFFWLLACYARDFQADRENRTRLAEPQEVKVRPDVIYITRSSLSTLLETRSALTSEFELDVPLKIEPYISKMLIGLRELLLEFWNDKENWIKGLPSNEIIASELEERYGFSKNKAKCGAALIKKSFIEDDPSRGRKKLIASEINALIKCAAEHWEGIESPSGYYTNKVMIDWLEDNHGIERYLAKTAAGIIRPETARLGGRPKK